MKKIPYRQAVKTLWGKIDKTPGLGPHGDCWEYTGTRNDKGYGEVGGALYRIFGTHRVNRIVFIITKGKLLKELKVCHSCDHPPCCRPKHLWPGTQQQNVDDRASKGRTSCGSRHSVAVKKNALRGERNTSAVLTDREAKRIQFWFKSWPRDMKSFAKFAGIRYKYMLNILHCKGRFAKL